VAKEFGRRARILIQAKADRWETDAQSSRNWHYRNHVRAVFVFVLKRFGSFID